MNALATRFSRSAMLVGAILATAVSLPAQALSPAQIDAPAALILDRNTGTVLWSKGDSERRAMASTTKIMTALLVMELVESSTAAPHYTTEFTVTSSAYADMIAEGGAYGSTASPSLEIGETLSILELLQAMLIPSDNLACYVLAESLAGSTSEFVRWMNVYATFSYGLRSTCFHNPNGFDHPEHYTTVTDLAVIAELALNKLLFRWIVGTQSTVIQGSFGWSTISHTLTSTNHFLDPSDIHYDAEVFGVKTGTTSDAGACLVAAATRGTASLLTVVLGSSAGSVRYEDSRALLDYGWDLLSMRNETTSYAVGDFNGDGYDDLAVGMPQAGAGGASGAGKVALLAGTATGIRTTAPRTINQGLGSIPGSPESGDGFGHAVAVGDFDGDGYDDLAVGSPWEDIHGELNAGNVTILYGSGSGLSTSRVQGWNQGSSGVPGIGEGYDAFGQSLAAGDFDGDGYDDLAIGIPGEDIEDRAAVDAGGVVILRGSPLGMTSSGAVYLHQSEPSAVPGEAETGDAFGFSLVAGHFDSDRYEDLAIGVPGEDVDDDEDAGMVCVIHGTSRGLDPDFRVASVTDDEFGASSAGEAGDLLGHALAAGDFNGDGIDDLAAGAPGEDFDSIVDAGAVLVAYGASSGLTTSGAQFFYEGTGSMGTMETRDAFGAALAAADFDGDGKAELAVGIPGEDETMANLGAAVVIRGTSSGLSTSAGTTRLGSNATGNEGQFGSSLAAGRFDGDGIADLAVAMPAYSASGAWTRGATRVFDGESSGLSAARERTWSGL